MPERLFPIEDAEAHLRETFDDIERQGNALRWRDGDGTTELRVEEIRFETPDEFTVSELVTVEHVSELLAEVDLTLAGNLAALFNRCATLSAFVAREGAEPARFVCKAGVFSCDAEAAERVYAPLMVTEAAVVGWHAAMLARGHFEVDPDQSPLTMTDVAPPFEPEDFLAAKAYSDRLGLFGSVGDAEYTCEFPWDPGAASNLFGHFRKQLLEAGALSDEEIDRLSGRTALFQATCTTPHPLYGSGVLARLEIPLPLDENTTADLVNRLNGWELRRPDLPPLFGAWCMGNRAPTFASFIPNMYCVPGLITNLLIWSFSRAMRVQAFLSGETDPGGWTDDLEHFTPH